MYNHMGTMAWKYDSQDSYACNQYTKYPPKCTMHYVKTSVLRTLALDAIKGACASVRDDEAEFVRKIREESELRSAEAAKVQKEQLAKSRKRHTELDLLIKRLYEDKVIGALSGKRFEILSREYENEQEDLDRQITGLMAGLERYEDDGERANKFIAIVRKYTDFSELTASMLNEFVEKILVHEAEGVRQGYGRSQKVEIYLNFIGRYDPPGQEEAEPFDPVEHQRAIWRNYYHRHREEIQAEKAARYTEKKAAKLAAMPVKTPEEIAAEAEARRQRKLKYQREYQREWRISKKTA
jgi:hypothetical protein